MSRGLLLILANSPDSAVISYKQVSQAKTE